MLVYGCVGARVWMCAVTYSASSYEDPDTQGVLCFPSHDSGSVATHVTVNASTMVMSVPAGPVVDGHPLLLSGMTLVAYIVADNLDGTVFVANPQVGCAGVAAAGPFAVSIQGVSTVPGGKTNVTCATLQGAQCDQTSELTTFRVTWSAT